MIRYRRNLARKWDLSVALIALAVAISYNRVVVEYGSPDAAVTYRDDPIRSEFQ